MNAIRPTRRSVTLGVACLLLLLLLLSPLSRTIAASPTLISGTASGTNPVDLHVTVGILSNIAAGAQAEFSIAAANADDTSAASQVGLAVTLPTGASFVSSYNNDGAVQPISNLNGIVTYSVGTLPANTGVNLVMVVLLPAAAPGTRLVLAADISSITPDPDTTNNRALQFFYIPAPDLSISLGPSDDSGPPVVGSQVTYSLYYTNFTDAEAPGTLCSLHLPPGLTFASATWKHNGTAPAITPGSAGGQLTFALGVVPAGGEGEILTVLSVSGTVMTGQLLETTASIGTTAAELSYANNQAQYIARAVVDAPDLWLQMVGDSGEEIGKWQYYTVDYGNGGVRPANGAQLQVRLPAQVGDVTFSSAPTSFVNHLATWNLGALSPNTNGEIYVQSKIQASGIATATAGITSPIADANLADNSAEVTQTFSELRSPALGGPTLSTISPLPVIFGRGEPGATVTLAVSDSVSALTLGTTQVQPDGSWVYTATHSLRVNDWSWIQARQTLDARISPLVSAPNWVSDTLKIDPNSLRLNDNRWGGIGQDHWWDSHVGQDISMRITSCTNPESLYMHVEYYDDGGALTSYQDFLPASTAPGGYVTFHYAPPQWVPFHLVVRWTCLAGAVLAEDRPGLPNGPAIVWNGQCITCNGYHWHKTGRGQWILLPNMPKGIDPDGLIYDAVTVAGGATMQQAIQTHAWVTATRETAPGLWATWDAALYTQVNPQYTDALYPDKVLTPGYYAFIVPPGNYRIQVRAPGYLAFTTEILTVIDQPITRHIGLVPLGPTALQGQVLSKTNLPYVHK
jgi:hypothetical protein